MLNTTSLKAPFAIDIEKTGQVIFATGLVFFSALHLIFGKFVAGRPPEWPPDLAGQLVWTWISAVILLATGLATLIGKKARHMLIISALMVFVWALLRQLPIVAAHLNWGSELTKAGKALTLVGGLLTAASSMPPEKQGAGSWPLPLINQTGYFMSIGRFCLGTFMIICGIEHFTLFEFVKQLVPAWIPGSTFWTYFTGIALIAGGVGLMVEKTAALAAALSGLMIFTWFLILHIPRAIAASGIDTNEWIAVCEAYTFSGIAFMLAGRKPQESRFSA